MEKINIEKIQTIEITAIEDINEAVDIERKTKEKEEQKGIRLLNKKMRWDNVFFKHTTDVKNMQMPKEKELLTIITNKSINQIAFIKAIKENEGIDEMICFIFAINDYATEHLIKITEEINQTYIVYSSFKALARKENETLFNKELLKKERKNVKILVAFSHAKLTGIKTKKGNYYILNGSGNMSANARIENYTMINDKATFYEIKDFILNYEN